VKCLVVSNSLEANVQLTRIHEGLFARDPTIASVWRRQTFSVAVESCSPDMVKTIIEEHAPSLLHILSKQLLDHDPNGGMQVIQDAFEFARMVHQSSAETFYQTFVPEIASPLIPQQIELITRCVRSEAGEKDWVGATVFPGLAKVMKAPGSVVGRKGEVPITQVGFPAL
jgi:hypothetical protein